MIALQPFQVHRSMGHWVPPELCNVHLKCTHAETDAQTTYHLLSVQIWEIYSWSVHIESLVPGNDINEMEHHWSCCNGVSHEWTAVIQRQILGCLNMNSFDRIPIQCWKLDHFILGKIVPKFNQSTLHTTQNKWYHINWCSHKNYIIFTVRARPGVWE